MATARDLARNKVNVTLYTAQYPEDHTIIPPDFQITPNIERSILDIGSFTKKRKLPFIKDILDRLYDATPDADYLIYTNVDIALQPHFYMSVNALIDEGCDAFVINRRTIPKKYTRVEEIPLMYSEGGESHPGWDCFVFKRDAYPRFILGDICIGANLIGTVLLFNLLCTSRNFMEFKDKHLTFHIGDDMTWKSQDYSDYSAHNIKQAWRIYEELERETAGCIGKDGRYSNLVKWMLSLKKELDGRECAMQVEPQKLIREEENKNAVQRQRVICITGMARCGTSMVARILNIMGLYLGPKENLILETEYNKTGCWEHRTLLEISDSIVNTLKFNEFQKPDWINSPHVSGLEARARTVIEKDFGGRLFWGWKDDRCSITLPFWQKIIPEMEYIICIRNPENAVKSLLKAKMIPSYDLAIDKWLVYLTSAIKNTQGSRRLIIFYEDFLSDEWKSAVRNIAEFLGPEHSKKLPEYEKQISAFITRDLQHHKTSVEDMLGNVKVPYAAKHFYFTLHNYIKGRMFDGFSPPGSDREQVLNTIAAYANDEAYRMSVINFTLHARNRQGDDLSKRNEDLNRRIEELLDSYSWRITAPLRKALDILKGNGI